MDSLEHLKKIFSQFPTIGSRTAGRFVYYLLKQPKEKIAELTKAIEDLSHNVSLCPFCFNPHESQQTYCSICSDKSRNNGLLCIVEKETDLLSLEQSKKYTGKYFILGGTITMDYKNDGHLRLPELKKRIIENNFTEIIIALNPTQEGKVTFQLVVDVIKETGKNPKVTQLARGIPFGGELEYADPETLQSALEGRK